MLRQSCCVLIYVLPAEELRRWAARHEVFKVKQTEQRQRCFHLVHAAACVGRLVKVLIAAHVSRWVMASESIHNIRHVCLADVIFLDVT